MQQICANLSTGNTALSLNEGRNRNISPGILMQVIVNS